MGVSCFAQLLVASSIIRLPDDACQAGRHDFSGQLADAVVDIRHAPC